jgi:glucose/arabinose dehydrogenase
MFRKPARNARVRTLVGVVCAAVLAGCGSAGQPMSPGHEAGSSTAVTAPRPAVTASQPPGVRLVRIGRFREPTYVAGAPGDRRRLFVVEKAGVVDVLVSGHRRARPFLEISQQVKSTNSEQGLLSIAFAPDYQSSGLFYVDYTGANNDVHVVQYRRSADHPDRADAASARSVVTIDHHLYTNHNGGQLAFGPDGDLYIGAGDGGSEGDPLHNGQNTDVLVGKVLRIVPRPSGGYSIPRSNPFVGMPGKRPEIWAYGLRNPWRFSFDRVTGDLAIGDVGQDEQEEIDFTKRGTGAGANYGWSIFEGDRRKGSGVAPHAIRPVLVARHRDGYCAIIGGYIVRDRALRSLYGRYLYEDDCKPQISSVKLSPGHARGNRRTGLSVTEMSSFGEDTRGRVYAVSLAGPVYRLAPR